MPFHPASHDNPADLTRAGRHCAAGAVPAKDFWFEIRTGMNSCFVRRNSKSEQIFEREQNNGCKCAQTSSDFGLWFRRSIHRLGPQKNLASDDNVEITILNRENCTLFTPMLHEVAASDLDFTHIVNPSTKC